MFNERACDSLRPTSVGSLLTAMLAAMAGPPGHNHITGGCYSISTAHNTNIDHILNRAQARDGPPPYADTLFPASADVLHYPTGCTQHRACPPPGLFFALLPAAAVTRRAGLSFEFLLSLPWPVEPSFDLPLNALSASRSLTRIFCQSQNRSSFSLCWHASSPRVPVVSPSHPFPEA